MTRISFAIALLSLLAACKKAPPCAGLEEAAATIQGDERSALAAKALVDACGRKLPAPWKRTLEAFARRDREAAQNELAVALSEKPQIFEDACEGGVRTLRGLGAAPVHGKRDYVTGACNFGEGGMASAAEFREAEGGGSRRPSSRPPSSGGSSRKDMTARSLERSRGRSPESQPTFERRVARTS
ncbi:MAG: hypothetical protein ACOX6T_01755 [Myxococcales bacterium]|jgi:hypothetical protein